MALQRALQRDLSYILVVLGVWTIAPTRSAAP